MQNMKIKTWKFAQVISANKILISYDVKNESGKIFRII